MLILQQSDFIVSFESVIVIFNNIILMSKSLSIDCNSMWVSITVVYVVCFHEPHGQARGIFVDLVQLDSQLHEIEVQLLTLYNWVPRVLALFEYFVAFDPAEPSELEF